MEYDGICSDYVGGLGRVRTLHGRPQSLYWTLNRDEDDQLVLDDAFDRVKNEQAAIVARVKKIEPVVRLAFWLVVLSTLFVIGYYIIDIVNQFK